MRARAERRARPQTAGSGLAEAPAAALTAPAVDPADAAMDFLQAALGRARGLHDGDPYTNPIALVALDLVQKLGGDGLDEQATESLIQRLTREAFAGRAEALRAYVGELDPDRNRAILRRLVSALAHGETKPTVCDLRQPGRSRVYYGYVFTAHPPSTAPWAWDTMATRPRAIPSGPRPWLGPSGWRTARR